MPYEARIRAALEALNPPCEAFRSAVAAAADEVAARLTAHRHTGNGRVERTTVELGAFAAGRLDAARVSALFPSDEPLDPSVLARIERAHAALRQVLARGTELFVVRVPPGGDLRAHVGRALAEAGRGFGAARAAELARLGRNPAEELDDYVGGYPFRHWNRAERQIAPPLVVVVDGADAHAAGLAEFLDGAQKFVLVLRGPTPPALLVRLISAGVFVMQTTDEAELGRLHEVPGPAIAALVPETAARFVHIPADARVWKRLTVLHLPEQTPRAALGSFSTFRQAEDLSLLRELATAPPSPGPAAGGQRSRGRGEQGERGAGDPVDRLAAWLLSQADFPAS